MKQLVFLSLSSWEVALDPMEDACIRMPKEGDIMEDQALHDVRGGFA